MYFSDVKHGELANDPALFGAISDLLKEGKTSRLSQTQPSFRGGLDTESVVKADATFDLSPDNVEKVLLGLRTSPDNFVAGRSPMIVLVSNGHLKYARYPFLIGHFERDGIFSAEKAINQSLNGEVSKRLQLGLYPGPISSNAYLETENGGELKGVIVVGLGRQGELNEFQLMNTIELGVSRYLVYLIGKSFGKITEFAPKPKTIGLLALLVGSGYGGLSIEGAVRAILQAIQNANQKVFAAYQEMGKAIEAVEFIEMYTDRALACVKAVSVLEKEENKVLNIKRSGNSIDIQPGRRERLPVDDPRDWWTRINVQRYDAPENPDRKRQGLRFAVSTDAARVEEDTLTTDSYDLFGLLDAISVKDQWTPKLAKVIFEMLIPNDFKQLVKRQNNISWQLDALTAAFPWELLQDSKTNAKPLSVNAGMIRQLATPNFRRVINSTSDNNALVVAEPDLEGFFGQLPGAEKEGRIIADRLKANGYEPIRCLNKKSAEIRIELLGQDYKIIHLAGHGAFEFGPDKKTGMLIGKDAFLTPDDIKQMSGVPELVFVNCCYLGQIAALSDSGSTETLPPCRQHRYGTDRNRREGRSGGWAVSDTTALEFAEKFYDSMFAGNTFGESVKRARQSVFDNYGTHNNTWGAYQCYGDPFYRLMDQAQSQSYEYTFIIPEEAEIELSNMLNQLETGSYEVEVFQKKMKGIALGMERTKISNGKIIELQALLYSGMGLYREAIEMFGKLGTLENPVFSFSAWEKYCNVRAKFAVQNFKKDPGQRDSCLKEIQLVAEEIDALNRLGCTNERMNLLGNTYKRLALVSNRPEKAKAYETSAGYYQQTAHKPDNGNRYYSMANWLAIENALVQAGSRKWGKVIEVEPFSAISNLPRSTTAAIALVKKELNQQIEKEGEETNFWDCIAEANLGLVLMLLGDKETPYGAAKKSYENVWKFTGHKGNRLAELEQLDFLFDLYELVPEEKGKKLLDSIGRLRRELEAIG